MAEQALRRLASASRGRDVEIVAKKSGLDSGPNRDRKLAGARQGRREADGAAIFAEMLKEAGQGSRGADVGSGDLAETGRESLDFGSHEGVIVNWDTGGWRRGGGQSVRVQ